MVEDYLFNTDQEWSKYFPALLERIDNPTDRKLAEKHACYMELIKDDGYLKVLIADHNLKTIRSVRVGRA